MCHFIALLLGVINLITSTVEFPCSPDCCACRRDERLRMRSELLAQQARRPSLDGTLARGNRWARTGPDMA